MIILYIILGLYLFTSILTFGFIFAFLQKEYPSIAEECYEADKMHALTMSIAPFVGMLVVFMLNRYKHGLKYR